MMVVFNSRKNQIDTYHQNWIVAKQRIPKYCKNENSDMVHILMLKTHMTTCMKYLCKTSFRKGSKSIEYCFKYLGSGKRWLNHLKKHGNNIKTDILIVTYDLNNFRRIAFDLSLSLDIVNRNDFANLTEEKGDGGLIGNGQLGKNWTIKDTSKMKGPKNRSNVDYSKISSGNNYQSKYLIFTPWGRFETWKDACNSAKENRLNGNKSVITDANSLKKYCAGCILPNTGRRTPKEWRGKHTFDLGFRMELK